MKYSQGLNSRVGYQYRDRYTEISNAIIEKRETEFVLNYALGRGNQLFFGYLKSITEYGVPTLQSYENVGLSIKFQDQTAQTIRLNQSLLKIGVSKSF